MTRAEYEATYGVPPPSASNSQPVQMTRAEYEATYGTPPPVGPRANTTPTKAETPKTGLLDKLKGRYVEGVSGVKDQLPKAIVGDPLAKMRLFSRPVGAAGRAVGDVAGAAVSALIPDRIEQKIGEKVAPVFAPVARKAQDAYSWLEERNPEVAKDVADIGGMAEFVGLGLAKAPAKAVAKAALPTEANVIRSEVDSFLSSSKAIQNQVALAERKNTNLRDILAENTIWRGIKVENGSVNPTEALGIVEDRAEMLLTAKRKMLPELDRYVPPTSKEILRQKAKERAKDIETPKDEADLMKAIDAQIDALPDNITLTQLDQFRARFRTSARNAKGLQKRDSEYTALENAARDILFDTTDNVPIGTPGEFAALNTYIKDMINTGEFLTKLRGTKVKGGRLGTLTGRVVGAIAGSGGGPLAAIVGSEVGAAIANLIANNQLGSSIKLQLIRGMTKDPDILKRAEELLRDATDYRPPLLPAGQGPIINQGRPIPVLPTGRNIDPLTPDTVARPPTN